MLVSKKKRYARWLEYESIRNGQTDLKDSELKIMLDVLHNMGGISEMIEKYRLFQKAHPDIFEDRDYTDFLSVDAVRFFLLRDWCEIVFLDILDGLSYGLDAFYERFGTAEHEPDEPNEHWGKNWNFIYFWLRLFKKYRDYGFTLEESWSLFRMPEAFTTESYRKYETILSIMYKYLPRHREIYDAYMNGKSGQTAYESKRNAMVGELLVETYRTFGVDLDTFKMLSPKDIPEIVWASGKEGKMSDYLKQSEKIRANAQKIQDAPFARARYYDGYFKRIQFVSLTKRAESGTISRKDAYEEFWTNSGNDLDEIWDFVRAAKRSRGCDYSYVVLNTLEENKDRIFASTLGLVSSKFKGAKRSFSSLFSDVIHYQELSEIFGDAYSYYDQLAEMAKDEEGIRHMPVIPGTDHLFDPGFCTAVIAILKKNQDRYESCKEQKEQEQEVLDECMKELCDALSLDWFGVMERYPELTKDARS